MKRYIVVSALLFLVLHFCLTFLYNFRTQNQECLATKVSEAYSYPLFEQNFQMFAPEPPVCKQKLYFRDISTDSLKPWTDPGVELLNKLHKSRWGLSQKKYNVYESIQRQLRYAHESVNYIIENYHLQNTAATYDSLIRLLPEYHLAVKFIKQQTSVATGSEIQIAAVSIYLKHPTSGVQDSTAIIFPTSHVQ